MQRSVRASLTAHKQGTPDDNEFEMGIRASIKALICTAGGHTASYLIRAQVYSQTTSSSS